MNPIWDPNNRAQQMALWNRVATLETQSRLQDSRIESLAILVKGLAVATGNQVVQAEVQAVLDVMHKPPAPPEVG